MKHRMTFSKLKYNDHAVLCVALPRIFERYECLWGVRVGKYKAVQTPYAEYSWVQYFSPLGYYL